MQNSEPPPVKKKNKPKLTLCLVWFWWRVVVVAMVFGEQLHPNGVRGLGCLRLAGNLTCLKRHTRLFAHRRRGQGLFRPSNRCGLFCHRFWKSNMGSQQHSHRHSTLEKSDLGWKTEAASKLMYSFEPFLFAFLLNSGQSNTGAGGTEVLSQQQCLGNQLVWLIYSPSPSKQLC